MEDFYNMADIGKNGYSYTGHTEGFIVPPTYSVTTAALNTQNFGVNGINAAVPLEYSEWKNSGLYVCPNVTGSGTTFTSTDTNLHTTMDTTFNDVGKFIISDDYEAGVTDLDASTNVTIDSITYTPPTYGDVPGYPDQDDSEKGVYTFTCSGSVDTVAGKSFRILARKLDVGTSVGVVTAEGNLCVVTYTPDETV